MCNVHFLASEKCLCAVLLSHVSSRVFSLCRLVCLATCQPSCGKGSHTLHIFQPSIKENTDLPLSSRLEVTVPAGKAWFIFNMLGHFLYEKLLTCSQCRPIQCWQYKIFLCMNYLKYANIFFIRNLDFQALCLHHPSVTCWNRPVSNHKSVRMILHHSVLHIVVSLCIVLYFGMAGIKISLWLQILN